MVKKISDELERQICRLYAEDSLSSLEIVRLLGISKATVFNVLGRNGIPSLSMKEARRTLSDEQELEICRLYAEEGLSSVEIAERFPVTGSAVRNVLERRGIPRRSREEYSVRRFSQEKDDAICELYRSGLSTRSVSREIGTPQAQVIIVLSRNGVAGRDMHKAARRFQCDHTFFRNIDTEEKAYWLGFLAADGCVSRGSIHLTLAIKDREHIVKFQSALQATHPINDFSNHGFPASRIHISSPEMCIDLERFGVVPRKTFTIFWPILPHELLRHYLRGYLDGDGGLYAYPSEWSSPRLSFNVSSNRTFLTSMQEYLVKECDLHYTKLSRNASKDDRCTVLRYGGRIQFSRIFHLLYDGATVFLERKYSGVAPYAL